jgi:hypothetical protein
MHSEREPRKLAAHVCLQQHRSGKEIRFDLLPLPARHEEWGQYFRISLHAVVPVRLFRTLLGLTWFRRNWQMHFCTYKRAHGSTYVKHNRESCARSLNRLLLVKQIIYLSKRNQLFFGWSVLLSTIKYDTFTNHLNFTGFNTIGAC